MKFGRGMSFGILSLLFGCMADYMNGRQMEAEIREQVSEQVAKELESRLPKDGNNTNA